MQVPAVDFKAQYAALKPEIASTALLSGSTRYSRPDRPPGTSNLRSSGE